MKYQQTLSFGLFYLKRRSVAVTLRTTRFKNKKFGMILTLNLCVLYGSQNKQQLLPYTALRLVFVT